MTLKQTILSTIQIMFCRQRKKSFFVVSTSPIFVEFGVYIHIITQSHSHSEGLPQWVPKVKSTSLKKIVYPLSPTCIHFFMWSTFTRYLFQQISKFLKDYMDVFYDIRTLKSIIFTIINWFWALNAKTNNSYIWHWHT